MSIKVTNDANNGTVTIKCAEVAGDYTVTTPAFTTELAPRMQLMTAQNSTSGTSIDFTGIPSWVKRITVMFNGVSTNGDSPIQIQLGTSAGIVVTGYSGSSTQFTTSTLSSASYTTGFTYKISGAIGIYSGNTNILNLIGNTFSTNGNTGNSLGDFGCITGGSVTLPGTLDRLRITTVNGTDTFDAGQINVLYEG